MTGTLPPIFETLPDLSLLFVSNNPGTSLWCAKLVCLSLLTPVAPLCQC